MAWEAIRTPQSQEEMPARAVKEAMAAVAAVVADMEVEAVVLVAAAPLVARVLEGVVEAVKSDLRLSSCRI